MLVADLLWRCHRASARMKQPKLAPPWIEDSIVYKRWELGKKGHEEFQCMQTHFASVEGCLVGGVVQLV